MFLLLNLIIFSLPLYLVRWRIFNWPTTVLEIMIYFVFLVWLVRFRDYQGLAKIIKINQKLFLAAALIFLGALLATIFSVDLRVSLGLFKGYFIDPLIVLIMLISAARTKKQAQWFLSVLSFSGLAVAVISLFYYFLGRVTFDGRLAAFYLSPNHLAMYLAPAWLISLWLALKHKNIFWLAVLIISFPLYLTYSYAAWLGVILGGAVLFRAQKAAWKTIPQVLVILFLISFLVLAQFNAAKFQNLISFSRSSLESRLMIWHSALKIAQNHPLLGIGPGMFQKYYLDYQKYFPPYLEWAAPQPHNLFLAFWLQAGLLGWLGFIWLLILFFQSSFASIKKKPLAALLFSMMLYIIIHGLLDTPYWKNDLSIIFWLIVSLSLFRRA